MDSAMEDWQEIAYELSIGSSFGDLKWTVTHDVKLYRYFPELAVSWLSEYRLYYQRQINLVCLGSVHSNWLLFLRVMQENKRGFFSEHSVQGGPN